MAGPAHFASRRRLQRLPSAQVFIPAEAAADPAQWLGPRAPREDRMRDRRRAGLAGRSRPAAQRSRADDPCRPPPGADSGLSLLRGPAQTSCRSFPGKTARDRRDARERRAGHRRRRFRSSPTRETPAQKYTPVRSSSAPAFCSSSARSCCGGPGRARECARAPGRHSRPADRFETRGSHLHAFLAALGPDRSARRCGDPPAARVANPAVSPGALMMGEASDSSVVG